MREQYVIQTDEKSFVGGRCDKGGKDATDPKYLALLYSLV